MNVLAIDTCLGAVSAAVRWRSARGEWLLREDYEERTTGHAERLFPMVAEVMEGAGLAFSAIDRIAVTVGPGTFTGVRVGIAAARGIALASGKPVIAITSLAAMAHRAHLLLGKEIADRRLLAVVDARRGMVYAQSFAGDGDAMGQPQLLTPEAAAKVFAGSPALVVGSGAAIVSEALKSSGMEADARLPNLQPHARSLAMLAPGLQPIDKVAPLYLRPPDAKPQDGKLLLRADP
jgi:tRNA threonylcarbamoyladenosine biosynthesis protein TsaB